VIVELEKPRRFTKSNENLAGSEHANVLIETRRVSSRSTPRVSGAGTWIGFNGLDSARELRQWPPLPVRFRTLAHGVVSREAVTRVDDAVRLRFRRRVFRSESAIAFQFDRALACGRSASANQANEKRDVEQYQRDQLHARR